MKKAIIILLVILSISAFAGNNKVDKSKEAQAKAWVNNQQLEFIENKGQFTTTEGKPAENVLFKTSFGSCDIYITDKGLSYVFIKFEENKEEEEEGLSKKDKVKSKKEDRELFGKFGEKEEEENKEIYYYRLDMDLVGASILKENIIKEEESQQGHYNYFYPHCPDGIYDVKAYGKITIKNIYKGIDWVIYTNKNNKEHPLKYDFIVHPEANYKDIKIKYINAQNQSLLDNDTKLKIQTIPGNIEEGNIYSYQNKEKEIQSKYSFNNDSTISFIINDYDKTQDLIIDPLVWATYYGGSDSEKFSSICVDSQDNIYITGLTSSIDFPIQQLPNAFWQANINGISDIIILKFNNMGNRLLTTYYGGSGNENGTCIFADSQNNIYITGNTMSTDFPLQQLLGAYWQAVKPGNVNTYILKFSSFGVRQWATYYGGEYNDYGTSIYKDSQDNIYITGYTCSVSFPLQQLVGAYWQPVKTGGNLSNDAFILKFNSQGIRLWATYLGGNDDDRGYGICIDSQDNISITGYTRSLDFPTHQLIGAFWQGINFGVWENAFISKFNSNGVLIWSTYYGGNGANRGHSICVDSYDNIYIVGFVVSTNFPIKQYNCAYFHVENIAGPFDAFILRFNNQGVLDWATCYGGEYGHDIAYSVRTDKHDNIYVTGETYSTDFPTQQIIGEFYQGNLNGYIDAFLLKFNNQGVRQWATYYGHKRQNNISDTRCMDIAIDSKNSVYFIGLTDSTGNFTVNPTNGAFYDSVFNGGFYDGIILKFDSITNSNKTLIEVNKNNICNNESSNIILSATGGDLNTVKWYSGSCGQNYIGENSPLTIAAPKQTTTYYARWETACDSSICDSIKIIVKNCEINIVIPNIITPNGDGYNDYFVIKDAEEYNISIQIYNRWGIKVFEDGNYKNNWNGKYKGKDLPDGVYYYILEAKNPSTNKQKEYHGSLTVLR